MQTSNAGRSSGTVAFTQVPGRCNDSAADERKADGRNVKSLDGRTDGSGAAAGR